MVTTHHILQLPQSTMKEDRSTILGIRKPEPARVQNNHHQLNVSKPAHPKMSLWYAFGGIPRFLEIVRIRPDHTRLGE